MTFSDADLATALDQSIPREVRKDVLMKLMTAAWEAGWEACQEEVQAGLSRVVGVKPDEQTDPDGP